MTVIEVASIRKAFRIPRVRRATVREHAFDLFRPVGHETLVVLRGLSFQVEQGTTIGIMGRNGCGKSTLLKLIAGIYKPDSGVVQVRGGVTAILELGVGWNSELDAIDNILLLGTAMGMTLRHARAKTEEILAFAELERFANLKVSHYSSGMALRLAYAVAFAAVRDVLILDEIFAVGDAAFRAKCEERYRALHRAGHTVVMVSHNPGIVSDFCDRALLLEGGAILAEGTGPEVARAYMALLAKPGGVATTADGQTNRA